MTGTFSMERTADPHSLLAKARKVARENGAILVGDTERGRFSHDMVGDEYRKLGGR